MAFIEEERVATLDILIQTLRTIEQTSREMPAAFRAEMQAYKKYEIYPPKEAGG